MGTFTSEYEKITKDGRFRVLLSESQIKNRIKELAEQISEDYRGQVPVVIGVLNGGFIFMADLIRALEIDCEIDFFKLSSYGDAKVSSGNVRLLKDTNCEVEGRHILLVEDIVDSGLSLIYMREKFAALNPASLKIVALLLKKNSNKTQAPSIDYLGFTIPDEFVVGYGMDYKQILRNLPAIYVLE